jgi:hypothetical protein
MSKVTRRLLDAAHAIHLEAPEEITFQHSVLTRLWPFGESARNIKKLAATGRVTLSH